MREKAEEIKGRVKEAAGVLTEDKKLEAERSGGSASGKGQEKSFQRGREGEKGNT